METNTSSNLPRPHFANEISEVRHKLCEAAMRRFAMHGAEGLTMRMLAADVGCSPMKPYRYFSDKDELISAMRAMAFDRFAQSLEDAVVGADNARSQATAIGDAYVGFALTNREAYRLMFDNGPSNGRAHPDLTRARARADRVVTSCIEALIADGVLAGDPNLIGRMFWAAIHGVVMLEFTGLLVHGGDVDILRREITRALFIGLSGGTESGG